jgi:molecular chaperone DnaK
MYKDGGQPQGGEQPQADGQPQGGGDNVTDVDFEEVKEDDKK